MDAQPVKDRQPHPHWVALYHYKSGQFKNISRRNV
jgi:hypothetical protein